MFKMRQFLCAELLLGVEGVFQLSQDKLEECDLVEDKDNVMNKIYSYFLPRLLEFIYDFISYVIDHIADFWMVDVHANSIFVCNEAAVLSCCFAIMRYLETIFKEQNRTKPFQGLFLKNLLHKRVQLDLCQFADPKTIKRHNACHIFSFAALSNKSSATERNGLEFLRDSILKMFESDVPKGYELSSCIILNLADSLESVFDLLKSQIEKDPFENELTEFVQVIIGVIDSKITAPTDDEIKNHSLLFSEQLIDIYT